VGHLTTIEVIVTVVRLVEADAVEVMVLVTVEVEHDG
jgi:hypothetical protein